MANHFPRHKCIFPKEGKTGSLLFIGALPGHGVPPRGRNPTQKGEEASLFFLGPEIQVLEFL